MKRKNLVILFCAIIVLLFISILLVNNNWLLTGRIVQNLKSAFLSDSIKIENSVEIISDSKKTTADAQPAIAEKPKEPRANVENVKVKSVSRSQSSSSSSSSSSPSTGTGQTFISPKKLSTVTVAPGEVKELNIESV